VKKKAGFTQRDRNGGAARPVMSGKSICLVLQRISDRAFSERSNYGEAQQARRRVLVDNGQLVTKARISACRVARDRKLEAKRATKQSSCGCNHHPTSDGNLCVFKSDGVFGTHRRPFAFLRCCPPPLSTGHDGTLVYSRNAVHTALYRRAMRKRAA
jgi:hypothetical protein